MPPKNTRQPRFSRTRQVSRFQLRIKSTTIHIYIYVISIFLQQHPRVAIKPKVCSHLLWEHKRQSELPEPEVPPVLREVQQVHPKVGIPRTRGAQTVLLPRRPLLPAVKVCRHNPRHRMPKHREPLAALGPLAFPQTLGVSPPANHVVVVAEFPRKVRALTPRGVSVQTPPQRVFLQERVKDDFDRFPARPPHVVENPAASFCGRCEMDFRGGDFYFFTSNTGRKRHH